MYKNIIKIGVIAVFITLNACSSKTYKIKQESDKIVNEVRSGIWQTLMLRNIVIYQCG